MIGIITAMDEELNAVLSRVTEIKEVYYRNLKIYTGLLNNQKVALMVSGVGKVNAAIATTILITQFENVKAIINVGIAGSLNKDIKTGDVVVATKVAQWDIDLTAFDVKKGFDYNPECKTADKRLYTVIQQAIPVERKVFVGPMVTSDQFVYSKEQLDEIKKYYPEALCTDMEGGAIAQAAAYHDIPFAIIRSISDNTTEDENQMTYSELKESACKIAEEAIYYAMGYIEL